MAIWALQRAVALPATPILSLFLYGCLPLTKAGAGMGSPLAIIAFALICPSYSLLANGQSFAWVSHDSAGSDRRFLPCASGVAKVT
jgi:hypothetical protein